MGQKSLHPAKAYQMRLVPPDNYRSRTATDARHWFRMWGSGYFRWRKRSPIICGTPWVKLAEVIAQHPAKILVRWKWGVTNTVM